MGVRNDSRATRIYIDAVCDLFHWGHVELFVKARELYENPWLIVGLNHENDIDYKSRPVLTLEERRKVVEACRYVDEVIAPGPIPVTVGFMKEHRIDILVHGNDITPENRDKWYGEVVGMNKYKEISYTHGISTTEVCRRVMETRDNNDRNLCEGDTAVAL